MSVPVHDGNVSSQPYSQPHFTATSPTGQEPTNEQLSRTDHLVALAAQPRRPDWFMRAMLSGLVIAAVIAVMVVWNTLTPLVSQAASWFDKPTTHGQTGKAPVCEYPLFSVQSASGHKPYCVTEGEYDALVAQANVQYTDALTRGKSMYHKWLVAHKLDALKTVAAREKAAKTYVCQSDYGEGALYAATKAGIAEYELIIAIDDKLITIDGYDPENVFCIDGKPGTPPKPPSKLQPKDPSRDPAANGNAGDAGGRNQDPNPGPVVTPPLPPKESRTNPMPPPGSSGGDVNYGDPSEP